MCVSHMEIISVRGELEDYFIDTKQIESIKAIHTRLKVYILDARTHRTCTITNRAFCTMGELVLISMFGMMGHAHDATG